MKRTMQMMWRRKAVVLVVLLVLGTVSALAESWKEFQITDTPDLRETSIDVSENIVVWHVSGDVMAAEIIDSDEFETFVVTKLGHNDGFPRISGRTVVWVQFIDGKSDIMAGTIEDSDGAFGGGGTKTVTQFAVTSDSTVNNQYPDIDGQWVTWVQREINDPGDNIACARLTNGAVVSSHIVAVTDGTYLTPRISGELIVWYEETRQDALDAQGANINDPQNPVLFDIGLPTGICGGGEEYANIFGQWVVWAGSSHGQYTLFADNIFDPYPCVELTQASMQANIAENIVVYLGYREGRADIYGYNLATATEFRITDEAASPSPPIISADRERGRFIVVWQDTRSGRTELYGMVLDGPLVAGCVSYLPADLNHDCIVDGLDFDLFVEQWLQSSEVMSFLQE